MNVFLNQKEKIIYIRNFPTDEKIAKFSTQNVIKNNVSLSSEELEKYCITMNK